MDSKRKQLLPSTGQSLEKISRFCGINLSSHLGRLYSLVLLFLFCFLNYVTWRDICTGYCAKNVIRMFMITLQYVLYILFVLTMVGISLIHPKQFAFPRQEMFVIDSILESYGAQFSNQDIFVAKYLQDAVTITMLLLTLMKYSYDMVMHSIDLIWLSIRGWYTIVCLLFIDGLFSHYVNDIYLRFHELNKIAIQHSTENLSVCYINLTADDKRNNGFMLSKIRLIQRIHHSLFVLATKVNKNFSLQLLIASAISLNAVILYLHNIHYTMKMGHNKNGTIVFEIIFVFSYALRSLYISYICQRSRNESRRMTKILHETFLKHKSLRSEVVHFSLQLVHEDLVFTVCGLYEINIPLMCSIAGAVVTYLVMVIQLDTSGKLAFANATQS